MLFNSFEFLFAFLPLTLLVFFYIGSIGHHRVAIAWLVAASLFYYGWWNPAYLGLILGSILFNYAFGVVLGGDALAESKLRIGKKGILSIGVVCNLALLGYFKYANFFVDTINAMAATNFNLEKIILPLAISFFTFQQIAYLVDAYKGETREYNFLHYCLFVCFFPQLIAGPIVHHKEMLPQFAKESTYRFNMDDFSLGLTIFIIGLFKKVVLADSLALNVSPVFDAESLYEGYSFVDSWLAVLAYTFQLYFDFSGYSDMAIGIGRMFGIRLPQNFNSPYKSVNIIDFWRRWHMTLSRFLRDYLYIPLGGNRKGRVRKHVNLMLTMLLGGLWHGAGWTFVAWGGLHGIYLVINHAYISTKKKLIKVSFFPGWLVSSVSVFVTFIFVLIAWVFFRAHSFEQAAGMLAGMIGENDWYKKTLISYVQGVFMVVLSFMIVWGLPNASQYIGNVDKNNSQKHGDGTPMFGGWFVFGFNRVSAVVVGTLFLLSLMMMMSVQKSEFLYYDF